MSLHLRMTAVPKAIRKPPKNRTYHYRKCGGEILSAVRHYGSTHRANILNPVHTCFAKTTVLEYQATSSLYHKEP